MVTLFTLPPPPPTSEKKAVDTEEKVGKSLTENTRFAKILTDTCFPSLFDALWTFVSLSRPALISVAFSLFLLFLLKVF